MDGLLVLATVGALKANQLSRRGRIAVWLSFWLGIAVSLAANIAAASELAWKPRPSGRLAAGGLALARGPRSQEHTETESVTLETEQAVSETETAAALVVSDTESADESDDETAQVIALAGVSTHGVRMPS